MSRRKPLIFEKLFYNIFARANRAPGIYDLKGSSAIEQEADYITFLHKSQQADSRLIEIRWYSAKVRGSRVIDTTLNYDTMTSSYRRRGYAEDIMKILIDSREQKQ
jgi:replicative DNA helicase